MRVLAWLALGLVGLLVVFTLAMALSGKDGALRQAVDGTLSDAVLGQLPRPRGERIASTTDPFLITVDRLPEGAPHSRSYGYSSGFLTQEVQALASPVPEVLNWLLAGWAAELQMVPGWEQVLVDVRVRRYAGLLPTVSGREGMDAMKRAGARVLAEALGLSFTERTLVKDVPTLVAGPEFQEKLAGFGHDGGRTIHRGPGVLECLGLPRSALVQQLLMVVEVKQVDLPEDDGRLCNARLTWDPDDEDGFVEAMAEQLDLHVRMASGEVQVYEITGPEGPGAG